MGRKQNVYDTYNEEFPKRLRKLLDTTGKTQKGLADYLGVQPQAVSQYINGNINISVQNLVKVSEYFDVSVDWLLGISQSPSRDVDSFNKHLLQTISESSSYKKLLEHFISLCRYKSLYMKRDGKNPDSKTQEFDIERLYFDSNLLPNPKEVSSYHASEIGKIVTNILNEFIENGEDVYAESLDAFCEGEKR